MMPDIATINKQVRVYLDSLSIEDVSLDLPVYNGGYWFVLVLDSDTILGTVILDEEGEVLATLSYPNTLDIEDVV
jgi:hypothetical protein